MKVYIKYSFIFDPEDTWAYKEDLDKDLALFFRTKGFDAEIIKSSGDKEQEVMLYISKSEQGVPVAKEKTVKQRIAQLRQKRTPEGRFTDGKPRRNPR